MNKEEKIEISVNQEDVQNIIDCYEKDIEYIKKLENNWNELKEWLNDYLNREFPDNVDLKLYMFCEMVMEKMQEIEGGVDNENNK